MSKVHDDTFCMTKLDYVCYLNESGYSRAAQDMILSLHDSGMYDIRITCVHGSPIRKSFSDKKYDLFHKMCSKEIDKKAIQIFHCIPEKQRRFKRYDKSLSYATFETYSPPEHWVSHLNTLDAVLCPSLFNYKIFAHAGIKKPIFHIPHTIDIKEWNNNVSPLKQYDKFTFLFIGTWRKRKGYEVLLESWFKEFSSKDNVQLIIHTDHGSFKKASSTASDIKRNMGLEKKDTAPIFIEDNVIEDDIMPSFIKSSDCFISTSFGEGFGLPGLQSMAVGVPVITVDFGGCLDYASTNSCTFIKHNGFIIHDCLDNIPQFKNKKWARVTVSETAKTMRYVFNNYEEVKKKSKYACDFVANNFSYSTNVKRFNDLLEIVYSGK